MPLPLIIAGVAGLAAIAATAWAFDESNERECERQRFRAEIEALDERIAELEAELRNLWKRFWRSRRQIRALAAEIRRLRDERDWLRERLAA